MGLVSPIGSKIDFMGDPFFESAAWFFVLILKFILTPIFQIQIHENNSLTKKQDGLLMFLNALYQSSNKYKRFLKKTKQFRTIAISVKFTWMYESNIFININKFQSNLQDMPIEFR